ncbi:hypothetical protein NDU88_002582 [Pleurodeles waltl]|uniref:Uncharacterized protein n=1 Tax=Pleurodeles waltl TaxID=8319 RepID=A0AAV7RDT6_PLEWA|nr:hypothetical protein NDU88_002582 [Pleurodeles waltl]
MHLCGSENHLFKSCPKKDFSYAQAVGASGPAGLAAGPAASAAVPAHSKGLSAKEHVAPQDLTIYNKGTLDLPELDPQGEVIESALFQHALARGELAQQIIEEEQDRIDAEHIKRKALEKQKHRLESQDPSTGAKGQVFTSDSKDASPSEGKLSYAQAAGAQAELKKPLLDPLVLRSSSGVVRGAQAADITDSQIMGYIEEIPIYSSRPEVLEDAQIPVAINPGSTLLSDPMHLHKI